MHEISYFTFRLKCKQVHGELICVGNEIQNNKLTYDFDGTEKSNYPNIRFETRVVFCTIDVSHFIIRP